MMLLQMMNYPFSYRNRLKDPTTLLLELVHHTLIRAHYTLIRAHRILIRAHHVIHILLNVHAGGRCD